MRAVGTRIPAGAMHQMSPLTPGRV
jgi:hypothetical protein